VAYLNHDPNVMIFTVTHVHIISYVKFQSIAQYTQPYYTAVLYGGVTRLHYSCNTGDIFHRCCDWVLRLYSPAVQCLCCGGNCWM